MVVMEMNLNPLLAQVLAWLAALGLTGSVAAIGAFGLFRFFGKNWLEAKFQERLLAFKAEKDQELEKLRAEISRMLDRAAKFNAKEYEILPDAWKLLNAAFGATAYLVSAIKHRPDLGGMSEAQLSEFLDKSDLAEWQKDELRSAGEKNRYYGNVCSWKELNQATKALTEYNNYILLNDIFIENDVARKMSDVARELRMAAHFVESSLKGTGLPDYWTKAYQRQENAEKLIDELRQIVRARISDIKLISQ
ncbi:MAG: hypothetical protein PHU07_13040 [Acidocella sp.]|nr:hypothetical protein [Acidocella sp.]